MIRKNNSSPLKPVRRFAADVLVIIIMIWLLWGRIAGAVQISDMDMSPAVKQKDLAVYYRLNGEYHAQDAVVIEKNGMTYAARIEAVSGDTVNVNAGELSVNGNVIRSADERYSELAEYPLTLGKNEYFVLCENYTGAKDLNFFGKIYKDEIKGKIITVIRKDNI